MRSVELAFGRLHADVAITSDAAVISKADGVILPGVGAFADAMAALQHSGLIPLIHQVAGSGVPFMGICLGMQALFEGSEEGCGTAGLGLIPGTVKRFPDCGLKIPHMGWNSLAWAKESPLIMDMPWEPYMYFVHSYACHAQNEEDVLAVTEYGIPFHAAVQRGNIIGVQFHPEKSGPAGEQLLRNFVAMTRKGADG